MDLLINIGAQILLGLIYANTLIRIVKEALQAMYRARRKPTLKNRDRRSFVLKHQGVLLALTITLYMFATRGEYEDAGRAMNIVVSVALLLWIRSIADVDTRIKQLNKQRKQARAAVPTPDMEEGV